MGNTHLVGRVGLIPGEEVEFTLFFDGERPQARNVRVTHAAPAGGSVNVRENPLEALTDAIQRNEEGGEVTKPATEGTPEPKVVFPSPSKVSSEKAERDAALKAQAAQAVEVPTARPQNPSGAANAQTNLEEQIRAAQTKAVDEKRMQAAAAAAAENPEWVMWTNNGQWGMENQEKQANSKLPVGTEISVLSFPAQDLVGKRGIVLDYDAAQGRYNVEVEVQRKEGGPSKTKLSLRMDQLQIEKIPA